VESAHWTESIPWWVKWTFAGGLGLAGAFGSNVLPVPLQTAGFIIGCALIGIAIFGFVTHLMRIYQRKMEPTYIIVLGLLIAAGGLAWQQFGWSPKPTTYNNIITKNTPLAVSWDTAVLNVFRKQQQGMMTRDAYVIFPEDKSLYIDSIEINAKSVSEVRFLNAYIISQIDASRIQMTINDESDERHKIELSPKGVVAPATAQMTLKAKFGGINDADFLAKWYSFKVEIQYVGGIGVHVYDKKWVSAQITDKYTTIKPHISKPNE
jgi:hypothetical protein